MSIKEMIMACGKCGCGTKGKHLCPLSLGLAVGLTAFLAVIVWSIWAMNMGLAPIEIGQMVVPTWQGTIIQAFWGLIKGFAFGFVVALLYDLFACCFRGACAKRSCNCSCCGPQSPDKLA
jgi:hypothetical protein